MKINTYYKINKLYLNMVIIVIVFTKFTRIPVISAKLCNKIILQNSNSKAEKSDRYTDSQYKKHQNGKEFQSHI